MFHPPPLTLLKITNNFLWCQVEGKEEGQGESGWIWPEKTWKELELRREMKSIDTNGKYFRAVATPNRKKPKEEEEFPILINIPT